VQKETISRICWKSDLRYGTWPQKVGGPWEERRGRGECRPHQERRDTLAKKRGKHGEKGALYQRKGKLSLNAKHCSRMGKIKKGMMGTSRKNKKGKN